MNILYLTYKKYKSFRFYPVSTVSPSPVSFAVRRKRMENNISNKFICQVLKNQTHIFFSSSGINSSNNNET